LGAKKLVPTPSTQTHFMQQFSEVGAVASRNSLYQILAPFVALGVWLRAKSRLSPVPIRAGVGKSGGVCYRELPRIRIPRTSVNKGERMSRWGNTGCEDGSVPIMGTTKRRRQAGGGR
jgi:hypothetical protein